MTTKIYENIQAYYDRPEEERAFNGVSPDFANEHKDWERINESNERCWNCYDCFRCSLCYGCSNCYGCYNCYNRYNCYNCYGMKNNEPSVMPETPKIESIHQKIFEAASAEGALNMCNWHTCETTHCRAGWVVHLAGDAGRKLEEHTSTLFAAIQIYKESSPIRVSPSRFFESDELALEDMKNCAEQEISLLTQ